MLDDDFFELDEDLLNATDFSKKFDETVNCEEDICQNVRYLNCTGEDQMIRHTFHTQSFIANDEIKLIESNLKKFHNQKLFDLEFSEDVLTDPAHLQSLLGKARTNVQMLTVSSRENSSFVTKKSYFLMRQQTTTYLFQLRHLLFTGRIKHNAVEDLLRPFALYLEQLNALPIVDVLHTIHSTFGNESTSPAYHLLHGHIEWRWIYLTICLRIEQDKLHQNLMISENTLRNTEFEEKLQLFLYDLILMSTAKFNKLHSTELPLKSPFTCTCMKEIWLLVQLLVERLHENAGQLNSFWRYFDIALNLHRERKSPYATMKQLSISRDTTTVFPNDSTLFPLWLLNAVAQLNGFSENGIFHGASSVRVRENSELLESLLKAFVLSEPNEQNLRASLIIVSSLLINWWPQKSELLMHFWEYFHKKLNSTFYLNGTTPAALAVVGKTASDYLEQVQKLIDNEHITTDMTSYTIFMNLLGKVLKRLVQSSGKNQIMKIIGRILTKFGESKLYALTEVGIHNLLTLFLILASVFGAKEIGQRLQSILLQLRLEKLLAPRQCCLIKGHMAMLIVYSEQEANLQNYVNRLLEQINKLNTDESKMPVLRIMIDALERILEKPDIFALDEYLLFDSWIVDYLTSCCQTEQEKCLQFINRLFVRIGKDVQLKQMYPEQLQKVITIMYKYILPFVKQIYRQSNVFGGVPDIAATFCTHANGHNGAATFQDLFKHFTEATCCDIQITVKFLVSILTMEEYLEKIEQIVIIRLWLKCSMLTTTANEDIRQLTKIVLTLPDFQLLCKTTETEMLTAKEPLSVFFASCGKLYEQASDQMRKQIADHLHSALTGFEKWIPISESPPAIFKIHIVIALIIFNCSPIVYVRSKPTCFFSVIMNHYILPLPLLMGKPQKMISIQAVHKVWHLVVGGIEKLDYQSDAQLQKVFTDLIVKWIPQFRLMPIQKIVSKPYMTCARHSKPSTLQFILEKLINNFLSAQRRETHQNAPIVVTILSDILGDVCNETDIVRVLLNTTTITLFEHAMMVDENLPSRTMIFDFLAALFRTPAYISSLEIRTIITSNLKTLTTKNLSYYASFFFQFMQKLARINSRCVSEVLPHIREQVEHVEKLRNAGTDARLRISLRQLEEAVRR